MICPESKIRPRLTNIDDLICKGIVPRRRPDAKISSVQKSATVHQFARKPEPERISLETNLIYRDIVCELCERTVSLALNVPLAGLQARTRLKADVALARQIAMYLCNTVFNVSQTEVGLHFKRDRTTVAHACALIEDKRDDMAFDVMLCQLEALLTVARDAGQATLEECLR